MYQLIIVGHAGLQLEKKNRKHIAKSNEGVTAPTNEFIHFNMVL